MLTLCYRSRNASIFSSCKKTFVHIEHCVNSLLGMLCHVILGKRILELLLQNRVKNDNVSPEAIYTQMSNILTTSCLSIVFFLKRSIAIGYEKSPLYVY